ncbi:MAG: hemerythrin family protein [Oscillospiraceae bacterium]|nr:hemerythrin family protein [Oscillospiraceae bacterium]
MWNDSLSIGVEKIDEQHKMLFSKVNRLVDDIVDKGEYQKERIISTILFLKEYALTHFADEEAYQKSINDVNYLKHKKMHESFIATVLKHEAKMVASDFAHNDVSKFTGTLFAWLIYHVSGVDQKIGKNAEDIAADESHTDIICDCFCNVISNMINISKESVIKLKEHNETFENAITVKHSFTHAIKGSVFFKFSIPFINELISLITEIPPEENEINDFEKTFLLQISTMTVENVYRRLFVDEYELNEAEIFITENDETPLNERISFDTGIGIVEAGFALT